MEDDEGDTLMAVEESIFSERVTKDQDGASVLHDDRSSPSPLVEEHDKLKPGCQDNMKSDSCIETVPITSDRGSEKNSGILASESDVPGSPKKVNGEVELSKCDRAEHSSDLDFIGDNTIDKDSRSVEDEGDDTNSESESSVNPQKRKHEVSPLPEEISDATKDDGQNSESNIEYKGFKKRILAQTSVAANNISTTGNKPLHSSKSGFKCKKFPLREAVSEPQHVLLSHQTLPDGTQSSAQLKEYAQYLGLQPTVKFKCYKCGESGFPSMLKLQEHQNTCLKNCNKMQTLTKPIPPPHTSEPTPSTNFKITRKVYLCSACGTYYENWNLFLHMREVHKRHICLFCLGMFSQVDKLATHLSGKHGVVEALYASSEQFINEFKGGSCFLMCCTCERIFSERENFFDHSCSEGLVINTDKACSLCGLRGAHFPTCRRAFTDSSSSPPPPRPPSSSSSLCATLESPPESTQNSRLSIQEHSLSVTKYLIPVGKVPGKGINQKPNMMLDSTGESQEKPRDLSDIDDDYDISNAASFCHVNIHEPLEKQKPVAISEVKTCKGKGQYVVDKIVTAELKPTDSSSSTNINEKCAETSDNNRDEDIQDNDTNASSSNIVVKEKEIRENQEYVDDQSGKIVIEVDEESVHKGGIEPNRSDLEIKTDLESSRDHELQSPAIEELESNLENDTRTQLQVQTSLMPSLQKETSSKSSPKSDVSPKTSPQTETKVISMTPSATEADSESESSESGDDTDDSSTSSEPSSEESDHEETKDKEKVDESDADNADSDKLSLVVDENKSEEEEKMELEEEKTDDGEKYNTEDKMSEAEDTKHDEPKSDTEMVQNTIEDTQYTVMEDEKVDDPTESLQIAGDDVPLLELTLEEHLDSMNIQMLLKESVKVSCLNCVYCNHAKKIAVNGKQLALHLLAEHRFAPVVCSDSGELTEADGFVDKLKTSLSELQHMFFNTDSYDNMDQSCMRPYDRTYECFHCHFLTTLHKELYVHNRKMHQKTILLCIMCKSNFYSYSELLCHLCPGIYVPESNINFRCCLCTVDGLPSAFRLMVHLRKRHHACDVCLETTGDQQKLSNHVWKHKLHHLCYRCGIAYRNKPDITKHLFWKHGTESVLCKKCLQKKWPHVYHFCIPPNAFVCEECNSSFSRAVALKVHKRLHAGDLPYPCSECEEHFISRKLLIKHQEKHREPSSPKDAVETRLQENGPIGEFESQENKNKIEGESLQRADMLAHEDAVASGSSIQGEESQVCDPMTAATVSEGDIADAAVEAPAENLGEALKYEEKDVGEKKSKVVDVYDLPPLNLSSESDDSDDDTKETQLNVKADKSVSDMESVAVNESTNLNDRERISEALSQTDEDVQQPIEVVDGVWDNFKTYKANLERRESQHTEIGESSKQKTEKELQFQLCERQIAEVISVIYMDHDYCGPFVGTSHSVDMEEQSKGVLASEVQAEQHAILSQQDAEKTEPKEKSEEEKKACDADHNYCYTNTSLSVENGREEGAASLTVSAITSPNKKKQKSPKKKQKRSTSSSSSDSSSNSDSSTCSCGTNCSCSSSSSSSSGTSSSQSSDSDSSSSEGRRRQTARRERRRERSKRRKAEEVEDATPEAGAAGVATNGPPEQNEVPPLATSVEPEDVELPVRESDLDTDETETDEDFYDKYPQRQANKLLAEKRNQLLLLAAVAPVNNGTMSQSGQSPPPSSIEEPIPKKKVKTKKHKKLHHNSSENKMESKLKLNIPTDYYSTHAPIFSKSAMPATSASSSMNTTTLAMPARSIQSPFLVSHFDPSTPTAPYHSTGSGSETDTKRLSKRKRVPKRFYGDSSDDEPDQPPAKWRKANQVPVLQSAPGCSNSVSMPEPVQVPAVNEEKSEEEAVEDSDSDREDIKKSSSESSNSESDAEKEQGDDDDDDDLSDADSETETSSAVQTHTASAERKSDAVQQKNENLYCYCQCPYDEVSEMIACDGKDCTIEWFHFECVGIMVPPKGKWFCPDCRKRAAARSEYLLHV